MDTHCGTAELLTNMKPAVALLLLASLAVTGALDPPIINLEVCCVEDCFMISRKSLDFDPIKVCAAQTLGLRMAMFL